MPSTAVVQSAGPTRRLARIPLVALLLFAPLACGDVPAADRSGSGGTDGDLVHVDGLGALSFPNSGAAEAQEPFHRGVLLLHSFEYEDAAASFREARERDPDFALAYWGEAMTYNHPIWNQKDTEAAREVLDRYAPSPAERVARAPTEREAAYLAAVDVLYGEDGSKEHLDTLYSEAMAALVDTYPDDFEARAFHALSLLGLSQGDRDVPTYVEAGTRALDLFRSNPEHPGAAHYVIHAFDDPTHAPLGLEAARAYSEIAPDAAHAQHMTSHIFLARGMWDDVVEANERADGVVDRFRAEADRPPTSCGHYNEWLIYGYQQQGRMADAAALLEACRAEVAGDAPMAAGSFARMRGYHLGDGALQEAGTTAAFARPVDEVDPATGIVYAIGDGLAAAAAGDGDGLARALGTLETADPAAHPSLGDYVPVYRGVLEALALKMRGDPEGAVARAREAADLEAALPVDFGPPGAMRPAREVEGDLLLEAGRPAEAMTAYRVQLQRTPDRVRTLAGYGRAAAAAGAMAEAEEAYRTLLDLTGRGDTDFAPRVEAEAFLARLPEESTP